MLIIIAESDPQKVSDPQKNDSHAEIDARKITVLYFLQSSSLEA